MCRGFCTAVSNLPDFISHTIGAFVGDAIIFLHATRSDFVKVYYPPLVNFLAMMRHLPQKGGYHCRAGLERTVLMPRSNRA